MSSKSLSVASQESPESDIDEKDSYWEDSLDVDSDYDVTSCGSVMDVTDTSAPHRDGGDGGVGSRQVNQSGGYDV